MYIDSYNYYILTRTQNSINLQNMRSKNKETFYFRTY